MGAVKSTLGREVRSLSIYIVMLLIMLWAVDLKVAELRHDINTYARVQCLSANGSAVIAKYNDQAVLDAKVTRLQSDLIKLPKPDCNKPII